MANEGNVFLALDYWSHGSGALRARTRESGSVVDLWTLSDTGAMFFTGDLRRSGSIEIKRDGSAGELVMFGAATGLTIAAMIVYTSGRVKFKSTGGFNLPVLSTDPDGSRAGVEGELVQWDDSGSGKRFLSICTGGTTWKDLECVV